MISIVAKKREATEAIKTVIANYSNSDDCSYFRSQVGAVLASLKIQVPAVQQRTNPADGFILPGFQFEYIVKISGLQ